MEGQFRMMDSNERFPARQALGDPNSSTMAMRSWLPAGVRNEWIASTLRDTAVEKPISYWARKPS